MKSRKLGNIENKAKRHSISCIGRAMEMNTINELQKRGCHIQER